MQFTHECQVKVEVPARDVFAHWAEAGFLPQHLSHVRATAAVPAAQDLSRIVIILDGRHIEFAAQRTMCEGDTICWQSLGESFLYVLTVRIRPDGKGMTDVILNVAYDPPGFLPDIAESLGLRRTFRRSLEYDLRRYADSLRTHDVPALAFAD